jgi:adhesin transport system outer membrane protein
MTRATPCALRRPHSLHAASVRRLVAAVATAACGAALAQAPAGAPDAQAPVRVTVTASSLAAVPTYTLRAAVADALAHSPTVAAAGADRVTAGYLRETAEWGRYPTLSAEIAPGVFSSQARSDSRLLRLDQPLWAGGRIDGAINQAQAQERSAQLGETEVRRGIVEQTAVTYLAWSGAQERLRIAAEGRTVFERLLAYVKRREAAGAAARSDISVAQARLASTAVQREQLLAESERARSDLQALVAGSVAGEPLTLEVPGVVLAGADTAEAEYLSRSNVVAQRNAEVEAARAAAAVRRGESMPRLSLRLERQQSVSGGVSIPSDNRVMLALSFTPEAGLAAFSSVKAAQSRIEAAQDQVRAAELDVRQRARTHLTDQQSAERQIAELQPQIESLQFTADSYMRQFEAGRRSWIEVLNTFREVLDTRVALSRARTQHAQSALHLMGNTGALSSWIETTP